jgi:hypothetical protein
MMRNQSLNNPRFPNTLYRNPDERVNPKYTFTVLLKDSTEKVVSSRIHLDKSTQKYYLLYENKYLKKSDSARKQKIYADETLNISRLVTIDKIKVVGVATDSCWLFKVLSGKINAYSEYAEITGIDATYVTAIQTVGGQIEPLIPERLESLISADEKAHKAFKRKQYYDAILRFNRANDD